MTNPLVSVIIPCYNMAQYLPEAVESILNQTYQNIEIVIVNDGSTDDTKQVIKELMQESDRVLGLYKPNGGLGSARNYGIKQAKGELILPLDADDKFEVTFIEKAVKQFSSDRRLKVVYCNAAYFGAKSGVWKLQDFDYNNMLLSNMIFSCAMFRRVDYDGVGGYNESILYEDWEFWLRLLKDDAKVFKIPETLFFYRQHERGSLMNGLSKRNEMHLKSLDVIFNNNSKEFIKTYGNPIEIELNRRRLQRQLDKPLIRWMLNHKNSILVKILEKLVK